MLQRPVALNGREGAREGIDFGPTRNSQCSRLELEMDITFAASTFDGLKLLPSSHVYVATLLYSLHTDMSEKAR